jgi:hypothetical protein
VRGGGGKSCDDGAPSIGDALPTQAGPGRRIVSIKGSKNRG